MKKRFLIAAGKTVASVVILAVILVGAGVGYTWYVGQESTADVQSATDAGLDDYAPLPRNHTPTQANPDAPASAAVQYIKSPVASGENTSLSVKTNPEAECSVAATYDEVESNDSGLKTKTADAYGVVSWTWTVDVTAPDGKWPVDVTCTHNEKTAVVRADLIIEN